MPGRGWIVALAIALSAATATAATAADNGRIYYPVRVDADSDVIFGANGDGTCAGQVTSGNFDRDPSTPADGAPVYYVHQVDTPDGNRVKSSEVFRMDTDGGGQRQITDINRPAADPGTNPVDQVVDADVSPNGRRLVLLISGEDRNSRIYTADADGAGLTPIVDPPQGPGLDNWYPSTPRWSPDGKSIIFIRSSSRGDYTAISTVNADGSGQRDIARRAADEGRYGGFNWSAALLSPDASQIAVAKQGQSGPATAVLNADGSGERVLKAGDAFIPNSWSPDGKLILASLFADSHWSAVTMKPDGSDRRTIAGIAQGGYWAPKVAGASSTCDSQGSKADDVIKGSAKADKLAGGAGDDTLNGGGGGDKLSGGAGSDNLNGGAGADRLKGGGGSDILNGGPGRDVLNCGPGKDTAIADRKDKLHGCEKVRR